ncbi:MAG TPA: NUDIX hydrolase [Actinomycetes bacterium]|nr:NUDIX hydrolase [Actinomycetes bacterium]
MPRRTAHKLALRTFSRLPGWARRRVVRAVSPHYVLGASCVLRHGDEVLMLRQRHDAPGEWALPGGLLERGELPRDGLAREIEEELGLTLALPAEPTHVHVSPPLRRVDLAFVVDVDDKPVPEPDGVEVLEVRWVPLTEVSEDTPAGQVLARVRTAGA